MQITIKFVVDEDGIPHQLHYPDQEAQMTNDQRWTFDRMRETYHACDRAIRMEQGMKRHAAKRRLERLDSEGARLQAQCQKDADEATRLLGEAG